MTSKETRVAPDEWDSHLANTGGYQLVVAGPGTGKTEFLVRRVTHLITELETSRDRIAVLTFSRRAAASIRERVDRQAGATGRPIEVATFHSLALRLLETAQKDRPVPLTAPEQVAAVQQLLATEDEGRWPVPYRGILTSRAFAAEIADFLLRCSERLLSPDDLEQIVSKRPDWRGIPGLFARYRASLRDSGRTDYGTLLVSAVDLLETSQGKTLASAYDYVLVDEYQDTSTAQARMADLLAAPSGNLTVAGDPYQSVYSFRGAELRNVAGFEERHPQTTRLVLTKSFRVPRQILDAALRIVKGGHLPGAAGPVEPAPHTGRVEAYVFDQETAEAEWIAAEIERATRSEGARPEDIAVLVRSKRELIKELSRALTRRGIPHNPPESRLVDHSSVRTVADLVTVVTRDGNDEGLHDLEVDAAMRRILLGPLVGATLSQERELLRERRRNREPWPAVIRRSMGQQGRLAKLIEDPEWATERPATEGFWHVWTSLPGFETIVADPSRNDWRQALASFSQVLARQADRDLLVDLARFFELTEDEGFESTPLLSHRQASGQVSLTTLHQSKGLEFDIVFIANAVEGVFPDLRRSRRMLRPELLDPERTTDPSAQHLFQIQEEMRLAYTAMTRARHRVAWTATDAGVDQGERRPSRFVISAAGVGSIRDLGTPAEQTTDPVTLSEFETSLRRTLLDPTAADVDRLAAAASLSAGGDHWDVDRFAGVAEPGPDAPILSGELRLSPSQGDAYMDCPRRYALERRLRLTSAESPYLQLGSLIHETLETAEREIIGTGTPHADRDRALAILRQVWAGADFGTPELTAAWLSIAEDAVAKLYDNWPSNALPIELEMNVEAEIDGITWSGRIDRLERSNDELRIVDYKTGTSVATKTEAELSIQLGFYAAAVGSGNNEVVGAAEFWYPRSSQKSVTTRALDMDRLDEVEGIMVEIGRRISDEDWSPRVNSRCPRCPFRHSCPVWAGTSGAYTP